MAQGTLGVSLRLTQGYLGYFSGTLQVRSSACIRHRDALGTERLVALIQAVFTTRHIATRTTVMETDLDLEKTIKYY